MRIAAGTLGLGGIVLGGFVHPGFVWLSAFVGAGLIFAGITDFWGRRLLWAKMPWNRAKCGGVSGMFAGGDGACLVCHTAGR